MRCVYCTFWDTITPRTLADWGYCTRLELQENPHVTTLAGGVLLEGEPQHFDRKPITHESFGCVYIQRVDAPRSST